MPQAPLTGSGYREHSYGGFGEDTHTSTCMWSASHRTFGPRFVRGRNSAGYVS